MLRKARDEFVGRGDSRSGACAGLWGVREGEDSGFVECRKGDMNRQSMVSNGDGWG